MFFNKIVEELHERFDIIAQDGRVHELQNINNELLFLNREINAKMEQSYVRASNMNIDIDEIAGQTQSLRTTVDGLKNKDAGSIQMYDDIKNYYNERLVGNWLLAIVIFWGGIKMMNNPKVL